MSLESVPGQKRARRFLKQLLRIGNVPHALLFSGMAGIGKAAVALEFAKLLNCQDPGDLDCCDRCESCRKISSGNHPDLIWVKSEGVFIKLDQIRTLKDRLRYRPFEGKWRVIVLQDAQNLRAEAGNALLKILEEPPKQNLFILLALEPQMLLPTIVSRCCHIRFQPLEDEWIEHHLIQSHRLAPERAREIAALAEGSLERAGWLVEEDRIAHWGVILENLQKLGALTLMDFFALVSEWSKKSEDLEQDLECIKLWVRDLIFSRFVKGHKPAFALHREGVRALDCASDEYLFDLYDQIEKAMQHLRLNANKQLTLEGICLTIRKACNGEGHRNSVSNGRESLSL